MPCITVPVKTRCNWGIGEYNSKGGEPRFTPGETDKCLVQCWAGAWNMVPSLQPAGVCSNMEVIERNPTLVYIDGANMTPRASYWHMEFVAKYFTGTYLKGIAADTNFIVYGAQDGDQLSVMIMNRGFGEPQ